MSVAPSEGTGDGYFVAAQTTAHPGSRMNKQLRAISELDRVIHEPGRLMIVALLAAVKECDFLYLLHETELNKGNLSSHLARLEEAGYVQIEKTYRGNPRSNGKGSTPEMSLTP
jgi:DNA-binding HxlR family transcriptional regulator